MLLLLFPLLCLLAAVSCFLLFPEIFLSQGKVPKPNFISGWEGDILKAFPKKTESSSSSSGTKAFEKPSWQSKTKSNTNNLLNINSYYINKYPFFKLQNIRRVAQQNVCIRCREAPKRCFYFSNMFFCCCWNENFKTKTTISFLTTCNYFVKVNPQKTWIPSSAQEADTMPFFLNAKWHEQQ